MANRPGGFPQRRYGPPLTISVTANADTLNGGGGNDTFVVNTTYGYYNTYSESNGGTGTIQAGVNSAFIGLSNNVGAAGITTIDANGKTGVSIASNSGVLDLSHVAVVNATNPGAVTILANYNSEVVTGTTGNDRLLASNPIPARNGLILPSAV